MNFTWHIIRKDLRRLRLPLALWSALMAAKILFYARISGVIGSPDLLWLVRMQMQPLMLVRSSLEPFIAFILVGALVFEDPLVGPDTFWVTRPISGLRLLGAKALGAVLFFVALPVLINIPWWLSCGFGWSEIHTASVPMVAEYASVVILGMGVAAATNGFARYFLWTIAGIAGVGALHLVIAEILRRQGAFTSPGYITGTVLTGFVIMALCVLVLCLEIIAYKYSERHFRRSLLVVGAATILCSALLYCSPLNIFSILGGWWGYRPDSTSQTEKAGSGDIRIEMPTDGRYTPHYDGNMVIPVSIHGLAADTAAFSQSYAEWKVNGASVWKAEGWDGNIKNDMVMDRMRRLLGQKEGPEDFTGHHVFPFPQALAARISSGAASLHYTMNLYLVRGRIAADVPIENQRIRHLGGSITVENVERDSDALSMIVTDRYAGPNLLERYGLLWPRSAVWALVDRKTGHMTMGRPGDIGVWGLELNMVEVASERMEYNLRPHSFWTEGAHLVVFDFVADRNLVRTLDVDPFNFRSAPPHPTRK